jgi:hypothetical protein
MGYIDGYILRANVSVQLVNRFCKFVPQNIVSGKVVLCFLHLPDTMPKGDTGEERS